MQQQPAQKDYYPSQSNQEKLLSTVPTWGKLHKEISGGPFDGSKKYVNCIVFPNDKLDSDHVEALQLYAVDLRMEENSKFNTCAHANDEAEAVLKLGGIYKFDLFFCRKYEPTVHEIHLIFVPDKCVEEQAQMHRLVVRVVDETDLIGVLDTKDTHAEILEHENQALAIVCKFGEDLTLSGWWRMEIVTVTKTKLNTQEKIVSVVKGLFFVE